MIKNPLPHVVNNEGIIINPFVQLTQDEMRKLEKFEQAVQNKKDKQALEHMEEAPF